MKYYLVQYKYDYADEFDTAGFEVVDENELNDINEGIDAVRYPQDYYFGTNEEIVFNSPKEARDGMKIIEITQSEYEVFKKFFEYGFGQQPDFASWKTDRVGWETDEED